MVFWSLSGRIASSVDGWGAIAGASDVIWMDGYGALYTICVEEKSPEKYQKGEDHAKATKNTNIIQPD